MKKIYFIAILLVTIGCNSVEKGDLQNLNGYWEIHKVIQPDGNEIGFNINTIYDYYEIDHNYKGFYKKAYPQLDGTFIVDEYSEEIEITKDETILKIQFHSEFNDRELTIIEITKNKLILKNSEDKTYYYKRAEPINLLMHEE
ncbi:MAG: lipocalin family protein [Flavobacteriaceae bacterium]